MLIQLLDPVKFSLVALAFCFGRPPRPHSAIVVIIIHVTIFDMGQKGIIVE